MLAEGKVGARILQDGAQAEIRMGRTGATGIVEVHGHFYEAVRNGNVYVAMNTVARALTVSLTTTASLAIWNPPNSGKNLVILASSFRYGSGTLAAGYFTHALFPALNVSPGGTAFQPINMLTGLSGGVAKCFELATGLTTAVQVRFAASVGAMTTDQSTTAWSTVNREIIDGAICVAPGTAYGIVSVTGAGTTPACWFDYMYEEVPA